jgi:hypothetical protein
MEDYIESNRILNRYSSNFYYHPFCTASYSDSLHLQMHLVTPNFFLTMAEVTDSFENAAPKRRSSYASYSPPVASPACVRTTYFGITGPDDPRVLALSYSIALSHRGIPIHAIIQKATYHIEVSIADAMYLYRGLAKYESGISGWFSLDIQMQIRKLMRIPSGPTRTIPARENHSIKRGTAVADRRNEPPSALSHGTAELARSALFVGFRFENRGNERSPENGL